MSSASLLLLSNALFFAFSALGLLASIALFLLGRAAETRTDRDFEAYRAQASAEVSHARVEVEQARLDAAGEIAQAALASQKAATLEVELLKQRAAIRDELAAPHPHAPRATRKHVARSSARSISRPVNISLSVGMFDTDIAIVSEQDDAEAQGLAQAIRALFDGGASVSMRHVAAADADSPAASAGVHIYRSADGEAQRLSKTLFDILSKNRIGSDLVDVGVEDRARPASGRSRAASVVTIYIGRNPES